LSRGRVRGLCLLSLLGAKQSCSRETSRLDAPPGYAPEYVDGMWLMLQRDAPCDLAFGTGETHSVLEFVEEAFGYVNLNWRE